MYYLAWGIKEDMVQGLMQMVWGRVFGCKQRPCPALLWNENSPHSTENPHKSKVFVFVSDL